MKLSAILVSVTAIAALPSPTSAQGIPLEHMTMEALDAAVGRVFAQPGTGGAGFGSWVGPTGSAAGSVEGVLVDADGEAAWELDASLTRYVVYGMGIEFGAMYGTLNAVAPGDDLPTLPTLVQGEWLRMSGEQGRFAGVAFQPAPYPQSVRVVGALRGAIRYDAIDVAEPDPAPAAGASFAGTAATIGRMQDDKFDLGSRGGGSAGPSMTIQRTKEHQDWNRRAVDDPAHQHGLGGGGGGGGTGGGSQSGAVSVPALRNLRSGLQLDRGPAFTISVASAPTAASLRDRFADDPVGTLDRGGAGPIGATGTFEVAYRMLD